MACQAVVYYITSRAVQTQRVHTLVRRMQNCQRLVQKMRYLYFLDKIMDATKQRDKLVRLWLSVAVSVVLLVQLSDQCGGRTHEEISERAKQFLALNSRGINYTQLILKHPDAYQAGAPYPDAYYPGLCFDGNFHDVSEQTHWTPFMNATINYIRRVYPRPWSEAGEKLVVFLLAVIQHQVADVNWHSLGIDQGFLETMGKINYHGSFGDAHSDGDFGGDVVNLYGLDMDYIPLVGTWYVPVDDLLNIYTELNGRNDTMYEEVVVECTNWLFLGRLGEHLGVIEYLYPRFAGRSTFLIDRLQDFFLGGVDDMAVWSANVYGHAVTMLDQGTDACDLPENPIYIRCNEVEEMTRKWRHKRQLSAGSDVRLSPVRSRYDWLDAAVSLVEPDDFIIEDTLNGVQYRATKQFQERAERYSSKLREQREQSLNNFTSPDVYYETRLHYSRLGEAMLSGDVNADGAPDLVIGAPGYGSPGNHQQGRVYIIYGSDSGLPDTNLTVEDDADLILEGPELNGRFGASFSLLDINVDGYEDLVVSAPSVGSDTLNYFGQVYVYFGSLSGISLVPDATITCSERYCNLGWSLTSGDVNNDSYDDLIVGAPFAPSGGQQRGFVGALYASVSFTGGDLGESDFDWRANGQQDYEWFGYSVTSSDGLLVAGAPTHRICALPGCPDFDEADVQAVGKVYGFSTPLGGTPEVETVGNMTFGQLGYTVRASGPGAGIPLLTVAATTQDVFPEEIPHVNSTVPITQLGHVTVYDSGDLSREPFFSVVGDREFGRMGASAQYVDVNDDGQTDLIVGAPFRSETIADGREEGRVYIYLVDDSMRGEEYTCNQADVALGLGEEKSRFGYSIAPVKTSEGQVDIAISAPHSNQGGRLSGLVTVHQL